MSELKELAAEAKHELLTHIIPFWRGMRDDKFGGYYGYLSYDLALDNRDALKSDTYKNAENYYKSVFENKGGRS